MRKSIMQSKIKTAAVFLLSMSILVSAVGCGKTEDSGGEWVESEVIVYENVEDSDNTENSTTSEKSTQTSPTRKNKNSSPDKLSNPNVTVFWPVTLDDHPEFAAINKAFEKKYGGKVTVVGAGDYDGRTVRLTNLIQSKTQVDVVLSSYEDYPSYPVSKLVHPIDTAQFDMNEAPYNFNKNTYSFTTYNGKTYSIKYDTILSACLLYNKTLFENSGEKTPLEHYKSGTWNWNTFRESARNLSADTNNDGKNDVFGYADYDINAFMYSNATSLLNYDGKNTFKVNNDERVKQAYQLYYDMYNVDKSICTDPWSWSNDMKLGKLAMVCQSPSQILLWKSQGSKFEYDFVPMPKGTSADKYYRQQSGGRYPSIGATCKNSDGAYAYIKFYIESTANRIYTEWTGNARFSADQEKRLKEYAKLTLCPVSPTGFGNLKTDARSLLWDIRGGKSVGSTIEYWNSVLQQDVDIALMTK